jgi:hypothetical protein
MQRRREGNWIDYLSPFFLFSLSTSLFVSVSLYRMCALVFFSLYFEFYSSISSFSSSLREAD